MTTGSRTQSAPTNRRPNANTGRRRRGRYILKAEEIDYKDVQLMRRFISERGKLVSGRRVGVSAKNQRRLARAIKRAQHLALIPMAPDHAYITGSIQTEVSQSPANAKEDAVEESEAAEDAASSAESNGTENPDQENSEKNNETTA